ncbi:YCF48-related protein [Aromatoleum toluclasticum]|uniref:WD40/YVTN/BNR-like repeat-containing protein n=1 Tax=Aromatoleum toluclasticum TaxID=92003 RepID=UPI001D180799|nr:YCF48-related protein [Aromatoleum toluclasticum]MCC4115528.1 YCF48-related protein [Aromatoleum toluclasticum]
MLRRLRKYGGGARGVVTLMTSSAPLVIVGGLLYAGLFVKAEAVVQKVEPPAIERRDAFYGVAAPDERTVWAVGAGGKIVRSEDGGDSWVRQSLNIDANLQGIAAWDDKTAVAVGNGGVVVATSDGGATWTRAEIPGSNNPNKLFRVRIAGDSAWAVGEFGALLRSTDRGATWTRVLPEEDRAWNDIAFVGDAGWLVGEFGALTKSTDGGATWNPVEMPNKVSLMSVAFRDARNGVAVGLAGTLLVTSDGGDSWKQVPALTREHFYSVVWDEGRWLAVGDKGVMASADAAAAQWQLGRVAEGDVSWRTQVARAGSRYFLAGSNLAVLDDGALRVAGRSRM